MFNAQVGKAIQSSVLAAAAVDSRNDAITTAAVLIVTSLSYFTGIDLDGWVGLAVAAFILWSGLGLVREAINPLLGKPASPETIQLIQNTILAHNDILGTHDLIVHDYGPGRVFASIHAEVDASIDILVSHELIDAIEHELLRDTGIAVVIHLDPIVVNDTRVTALREWISHDITSIDSSLSIHDLRIVPGENRTNVIFDCFEPYSVSLDEEELKATISQRVSVKFPGYKCVIQIDRG